MTSAQMKAKAKAAAAKNKAKSKSAVKKKGTAKPAVKVKNTKVYKNIKSTSNYKPKFEKVSDEKLEMASPSPAKNTGDIKKNKSKIKKEGKVYKYKYKDSDRKIKGKDVASKNKSTKIKQTIKNKNVEKGEVKKVKTKSRVGNPGTTKKKIKGGKNTVEKAGKGFSKSIIESPMNMTGRSYDMKMAYDKKLTPKARLHYLENERHDADSPNKMNSPYKKHGSPYHMGHKHSPMNKELVGKQHNLPEHLKKKIEAAPEMKGSPYHMSNELKYGGPVIDQMKSLSQASSFKVLKHMKSKI